MAGVGGAQRAARHRAHRLRLRGDAGPDGLKGRWDRGEQEAMADRIEEQVERYAPGFRHRILARRGCSPSRSAHSPAGAAKAGPTARDSARRAA
ncbi:hypothetical protein GT002_12195 [Streptomyces sp. SID4917]|nr:hypothetical protein [Streptomyces sp. SID4917]